MYLHYEDPRFDDEGQALYATHVIFDSRETKFRGMLVERLKSHETELRLAKIAFELRETSIYIDKSVSRQSIINFMCEGPPLIVGAATPKTVMVNLIPNPKYL